MYLVYEGVGTSYCATHSFQCAWITPPLNKGVPGILMALNFLPSAESPVNLPILERLQNNYYRLLRESKKTSFGCHFMVAGQGTASLGARQRRMEEQLEDVWI